ncbi:hypothetical protein OH687_15160 [Burkholderia anthina]|nr:hypothetical protein OH687_15160 [Burkholderia anthina]
MCRREAANVSARAANPNQQMVLCSAGFVMRRASYENTLPPHKKTPAASSGRESQSRRCHTNYGFRVRKSPATGNESISISI